ncbi:MAG TPA: DUF5808 domain-containing protein [Candidatus Dormibacteraeota bacterium]|jgi:hypothetical protein|nr:DUF5808 domain-containing protein [Candidatus Dormibacteraeota bacterium]
MKIFSLRRVVKVAVVGVTLAAIAKEMSKSDQERTWQGQVAGIPYDFRPPTWERLKDAYWNPASTRIFTDRPFGIGWGVNFARVYTLVAGNMVTRMSPPVARWSASGLRRTAAGIHETAEGLRQVTKVGRNGH